VNVPLTAYTWRDSGNNIWPICNTKFMYGTLGSTYNVEDTTNGIYYTCSNTTWGSLNVASISQGNSNLVELSPFTDKLGVTRYTISVNQSGIYRIRTTLTFSGINFTSGTNIYFKFGDLSNNNTALPIDSTSNPNLLSLSSNQILSLGYVYTNNSTSYPSIVNTLTSYLPYFTLIPTYSTSTTFLNNGFSVIEQILYLQFNTPLYFNIASVGSNTYVNSTGNFTFELLSLSFSNNPTITNSSNVSNSGIQLSNGYKYIEFYPTSSSVSGTATIEFLSAINLNYLLVGGGGGGGGSGGSGDSSSGDYSGGGGGGGSAINGSTSGTTFNISVGNLGTGGYGIDTGLNAANTSIGSSPSNNNIAIAYGGGGGGAYYSGSSQGGGVWNPVSIPSGNGTKYLAANGGNGHPAVPVTDGQNGYVIDLLFNTYSIGGAGAGGGNNSNQYGYSGKGGNNNVGGIYPSYVSNGNGTAGTGYGTGGGGAQSLGTGYGYDFYGGNGGEGLLVLYWQD
jgi:hypothetical protein